jgi:threonine dehydrogenase-like Zn-dependent dehydrogenase
MKALVLIGETGTPGELQLVHDYVQPSPGPGEVRIRTRLAAICNTDLEIARGYAGFRGVPGHEFVGIVDCAEDRALVGKRVVGEINIACGECEMCRLGHTTHCRRRRTLGIHGRDGALAEYLVLPERNLHLVPAALADEAAVFVEPLAAACQILDQIHLHPTDRVIVLGDGKLGLLVAQVLALTGCDLTVVGRHEDKLAILAAQAISTRIGSEGLEGQADIVVECTGRVEGFATARDLVRPRGTMVLKSTYYGLVEADLSSLVVDEIQVVGSRCGPFPAALRLLADKRVDVTPLIEAEYPIDQGLTAFEHAARRGSLKVLVRL